MTITLAKKVDLAFLPTPLHPLTQLSEKLGGPAIYIKRDDQTGLALGGNKTRKLEFILAQALAGQADCVITAGASQSNHCRQTAAAAARLGLECHLILGGEKPADINGNILLDTMLGAHLHFAGNNRKGEDIPALVESLKQQGKRPFVVPYGGSNCFGAMAYINAMGELKSQLETANLKMDHIVFASSSGGTHAGLALGNQLLDLNINVMGINNDKQSSDTPLERVIETLCTETLAALSIDAPVPEIKLNHDYIADGYGVINQLDKHALSSLAQTEGIILDPVYTGRAMGALIDMIRQGKFSKDDNVLFWHTGGAPAVFAYAKTLVPA
ncbi:D-cysteine desulfhydrase family protein [Neptunicella marina]|uniref:D-cysteine desulfhydrase family protein n=1 Tax=Neptunicella marina TaxID=2125989 RepID=A0A8J6IS18_9ALTE|nr:D-cysteine desulfhydrase family protein [Neptunicella marina]MBC3765349.1 D-cysteine desulfhydrase family protein [Neptunicella marina]